VVIIVLILARNIIIIVILLNCLVTTNCVYLLMFAFDNRCSFEVSSLLMRRHASLLEDHTKQTEIRVTLHI